MVPLHPTLINCTCLLGALAAAGSATEDPVGGMSCSEPCYHSLLQVGVSVGPLGGDLARELSALVQGNQGRLSTEMSPAATDVLAPGTRALVKRAASHGLLSGVMAGLAIGLVAILAVVGPFYWKAQSARTREGLSVKARLEETEDGPDQPRMRTVLFFVLGHSLSASTLTVVNKWAMNSFHPPLGPGVAGNHHHGYVWTLSLLQFATSAIVARLVGLLGVGRCERLEWSTALAYFPAAGMFMISIVAGNAVMNFSTVSTFLVLRSLVPLPCALLEHSIYKEPWPPLLSWAALSVVVTGAVTYCTSRGGFEMGAIAWALMFLVCMPVDGLLIKHAISSSSLSSWGLVYYNNTLASMPLLFYVLFFELPNGQAISDMISALLSSEARLAVGVSCLVGISLSYFQMTTRYYISATAFMVLGVVNKFLTLLWSEVFVDSDSTIAQFGVLLALSGAVGWQLSVGNNCVKVRTKSEPSQRLIQAAFIATITGLAAAAYVQHLTMVAARQVVVK